MTLEFGSVYWKSGKKSADNHFIVVLGVDDANNEVWHQHMTSQVQKLFKFPNGQKPRVDIDTVTFLNYDKYSYLDRDTCVMLMYGVSKENRKVFEQNIASNVYKLQPALIEHNKRYLILTLKCSTEHSRLSDEERKKIIAHYALTN